MDGKAGWWTTSGKIGLLPLAMVKGVGRQLQQTRMCGLVGADVDLSLDMRIRMTIMLFMANSKKRHRLLIFLDLMFSWISL